MTDLEDLTQRLDALKGCPAPEFHPRFAAVLRRFRYIPGRGASRVRRRVLPLGGRPRRRRAAHARVRGLPPGDGPLHRRRAPGVVAAADRGAWRVRRARRPRGPRPQRHADRRRLPDLRQLRPGAQDAVGGLPAAPGVRPVSDLPRRHREQHGQHPPRHGRPRRGAVRCSTSPTPRAPARTTSTSPSTRCTGWDASTCSRREAPRPRRRSAGPCGWPSSTSTRCTSPTP